MGHLGKRLLILAVLAILLAGSGLALYYGLVDVFRAGPGVKLTLSLYDVSVDNRMLLDATSILDRPEVLMYLEVSAITPPGFKWADDLVPLFRDTIKARREVYIQSEEFREIARGWVSIYMSRGGDPEQTYSGLVVRLFIFNNTSREIIFDAYDSVSYKPSEVARGKAVVIDITLLRGSKKPIKLSVEHGYVSVFESSRSKIEKVRLDGCPAYLYRKLVAEIKPEDLKSKLPAEYFWDYNERTYIKTPVLIAENTHSYSGTVGVSISIGVQNEKVGVYPTFTSGKILELIKKGEWPSVTLWKGSGFTWGGSTYYYGYNDLVKPLDSLWMWVWARPVYRVYEVYIVYCVTEEYIGDDVENVIGDMIASGSTILGGMNRGLPHSELMNTLFSGTNEARLSIPGTFLEDGDLDPGEYVELRQIFRYFDTCGDDFEIGIPAGAIAALGICAALGLQTGSTACTVAVAFASTFQLSISAEGASIHISGNVVNHGDHPYVDGDYNVFEIVYARISKYQYKKDTIFGTCYFNVPAGIHFRFD